MLMTLVPFAQDVTFVSDFQLVEVQDGIFVNWQIDSGNTCQGVDVLRSSDGISFEEIGHISGVCGSLTKPVSYSFLDESPEANSNNYYQLKLNGHGFTNILSLYYIEIPSDGVLIYPNPTSINETVTVKFNNLNQLNYVVEVFGADGTITSRIETSQNELGLPMNELEIGYYLIRVTSENDDFSVVSPLIIR